MFKLKIKEIILNAKCSKIYSPTQFDAAKALKLEDEFADGCMTMYPSADKLKMSTPTCFPGRYSPTYRGPDQMRRCMTNPSVSTCVVLYSSVQQNILMYVKKPRRQIIHT